MTAVHKTVIFFPIKAQENSPFSGYSCDQINTILECCLQQMPDIVDGYTLGGGAGRWHEESAGWLGDQCKVIEIYTEPYFATNFRKPNEAAARFLASLSYLSCVQMGHKLFFSIVENQRCLGDKKGLHIGPSVNDTPSENIDPSKKCVPYAEILTSSFWLQLPFKVSTDDA